MAADIINILIVEDESLVALDLKKGLEKEGYRVVGIADRAEKAFELFREKEVDIVLMDIHLSGAKDGVETTMELMRMRSTPVIYLTAFSDAATVERVKQTYPAAFLTKPYAVSNVRIAIELALNNFAALRQQEGRGRVIPLDAAGTQDKEGNTGKETILVIDDCIFVKHNYQFVKIRLADILFLESERNFIHLHTTEKKFVLRLSLNQLFEKLLFKKLVRIHRSYAVNLDAIRSFNDQDVMIGDKALPIGRSYKEEFLQHFNFR